MLAERPPEPASPWWHGWVVLLPAVLLFGAGALLDLRLPGPYMDAVNPDYIVVRLLHPSARFTPWMLPGTLLLGRLPVLVQLYHGALPFYLGLPAYAAFGTGIVGIRVANLTFGLLVLLAAGAFLRAFRVRPLVASACLAALAVDPGFVFAWRTQFYITLLPAAPLLAALALAGRRRGRGAVFLAGLLAGVAGTGYFVFLFLAPAVLARVLARSGPGGRIASVAGWLLGFLCGLLPYPLGLMLMLRACGSVHGFLAVLSGSLHALDVGSATGGLGMRLAYFWRMVLWTVADVGPSKMMLHASVPGAIGVGKAVLLLGLPAIALVAAWAGGRRAPGLESLLLLFAGFAVLFVTFGDRLWLHHLAALVPVLYLALALSLGMLPARVLPAGARNAVLFLVVGSLLVGSVLDQGRIRVALRRTGGVGLASSAITRLAEDSYRNATPTVAFLPDWGVFMSFVMITEGRIPTVAAFDPVRARQALCGGQDVLLVLVRGQPAGRPASWASAVGGTAPDLEMYRQRDGIPVLDALRWRAASWPRAACVTP